MKEQIETEQILRDMHKLVDAYEKAKRASVVHPIPIVEDRQGRLAKDATLKDWLNKINEEIDELKEEVLSVYTFDDVPSKCREMREENKKLIVGELCDVIEVLYSMASQMGIDGDMIQAGIHDTNKKLKGRGCI